MALRKTILTCIVLAVTAVGLLAQTDAIHIRVLDGRTGKNLSGKYLTFVDYHNDRDGTTHDDLNGRMIVRTSPDGDLYVANADAHGVLVFNVLGSSGAWVPCTRQKLYDTKTRIYGSEHLYPVSTIIASGLVAKNDCSRRTAAAKPGELIVFVRPPTWWEKFVWVWKS